ncbi:MAG: pirin family protein [Pseudomonadota bacterium]
MITVRKSDERGRADFGWLKSRHSFSFGSYYDPKHRGFRSLRVINDDHVAGGAGFGEHGHRDMEIVSYVLDGALEHRDSLGNGSVLRPGDVQRMTAGAGVRHSEFNGDAQSPVEFLQIWIEPEKDGLAPGYEEKRFDRADRAGELKLLASRDGRDGSLTIHQDVDLYGAYLDAGDAVETPLRPGRGAWVQVARGSAVVNGVALAKGDGAAIEDEDAIRIEAADGVEALVFDLA